MKISVSINEKQAIAAFQKAPVVMERTIDRFMGRGALEIVREARFLAPKARFLAPKAFSTLTHSIRSDRVGPLHYRASTGVNYARYVEDGSKPHFPPVSALVPWVERALGLRGQEAHHKAFLIARSISRKGIKPHPYMKPAAERKESRVRELIRQGVAQGIKESFGG